MVVLTKTTNTENIVDGLSIFPNPTSDYINIKNESDQTIKAIRIYNVLGQQLHLLEQVSNSERIDVSNWLAGIYFVHIEIGDHAKIIKIMVD